VTLYYEDDSVMIFHADCRDVLGTLHANAVVTDPPYGETSLDWDVPVSEWARLLIPDSLWCFGSLRMFMRRAEEFAGWNLAQDVVWEKHNGSNFHADRFRRVHEIAAHFYRGAWDAIYKQPVTTQDATARAVRRKERPPHTGEIAGSTYTSEDGGPRLMRSVIAVPSCHGYAQHPTQKPVGILRPLIEYSTPVGGVVLDPFMGSGSTLVAAKEAGRAAIGVDVDERYCEIAAGRCAQGVFDIAAASMSTSSIYDVLDTAWNSTGHGSDGEGQ